LTQRALARPWLRPSVAALVALADDPPEAAPVRPDPGLVLHALRYTRPTPTPDTFCLDALTLGQPGLCETAAALLDLDESPEDADPAARQFGRKVATVAEELAKQAGLCSPDAAWAVGLLAGYYADAQPVARKLLARWKLPVWVTAAVGFSELPLESAVALGGHVGLLRVVRAALRALSAPVAAESDTELDSQAPFFLKAARALAVLLPEEPSADLLPRLLRQAAKLRRREAGGLVHELEDRVDRLTAALIRKPVAFDAAVRDAKLAGLAEFAAGASHEINTPLAVISTNVQLLRSHEEEPERIERYDAVLRQTKRIHELLHGARLFARPPRAVPVPLTVASPWVAAVAKEVGHDAADRRVALHLPSADQPCPVRADAGHVRTAVSNLVRNAIQAAGDGGWVAVRIEPAGGCVRIVVEDSGPGPTAQAAEHLFDPFYSGHTAGRGRGLGLSIAWRLAKQNGGDVSYEHLPTGPTRFVLTLPATAAETDMRSERRSA
jgi:signal transduction histidine kinase